MHGDVMGTILIVEDEVDIHEVLEFYFEDLDLELDFAVDYEEAVKLLNDKKFQLILSDVKLGEGPTGIDLLKTCKEKYSDIPFVVMTSFISALDAKSAYQHGADEFVAKPINQTELQTKVMKCIDEGMSYKKKDFDDNLFCEVPLSTFVSGKKAPFDIYIKLRPGKYIKVANKTDEYNYEILNKFKEKGIEFLHALKDEFKEYTLLNLKVCKALKVNKKISSEKKNSFLVHSNNILQENAFKINLDESVVKYLNFYAKNIVEVISESSQVMDLVDSLRLECPDVYNYSLLTAIYSLYVAHALEWESEEKINNLFMAGLMHDIGLKQIDKEILNKDPLYLTNEEKQAFNEHPIRGMEILSKLQNVPTEVILAAYQHHETTHGTGYPQKLKSHKISPFSKIVFITSHFAIFYLDNLKSGHCKETAKERAFNKVVDLHTANADSIFMTAFIKIFKGS
jgi:putative nucleotidyltransferase with HDIG domain